MPEAKDGGAKQPDPFEPFRGVRDAYLDAMSKAMIDAVNTEGYAQVSGAMLDYYLTASAPFRESLERAMTQALAHVSLPSREELAALAERFTNMEMRLDDLDAKIDRILKVTAGLGLAQVVGKEPKRGRAAAKQR